MLWMCSISKSFSQSIPTKVNNDLVTVSKEVAKNIAKNLILKDAYKAENVLLRSTISNLDSQLSVKDTVLIIKEKTIHLKDAIIGDKDKQKQIALDQVSKLNKKIRWQNTKLTIAGGLILGLGIFALIK